MESTWILYAASSLSVQRLLELTFGGGGGLWHDSGSQVEEDIVPSRSQTSGAGKSETACQLRVDSETGLFMRASK